MTQSFGSELQGPQGRTLGATETHVQRVSATTLLLIMLVLLL